MPLLPPSFPHTQLEYTCRNVPESKLFSIEYSVEAMMTNVIEKLSLPDTGKYLAWDGTVIPY